MLIVRSTLALYTAAALDAARATLRSAWGFLLLVLLTPVLYLASMALSPLGMLGGLAVGLLTAACAGSYLACIEDALGRQGGRSLSLANVQANLGRYTWDVIGVSFPIWIGQLVVGLVPLPLGLVYGLVVSVAFNAAPEMIGRFRGTGTELLLASARWLRENGPEWFIPQILLLFPLALWRPGNAVSILAMFGPQFGFVNAGSILLGMAGPLTWLAGFGMVLFVHALMLFRAALYTRLGPGGRRQRLWRARVGAS